MAVVVDRIVGGICDDGAIAQAQGEKYLRGSLSPHLQVTPDFQLDAKFGENARFLKFGTRQIAARLVEACAHFGIKHVRDSVHRAVQH